MEPASRVNLRIVNVTDCYMLDNFPALKTLVNEKREEVSPSAASKFATILTGDFLAPYLLSSIDKGTSMIDVLNATPVDYVIFGNHEDDIETKYVNQRIVDFQGIWINTNMQDHAMFHRQRAFDIIELVSPDGTNKKRIGLIGILSNAKSLYRKNAFGGATIADPWETISQYKGLLEKEHKVDLVIPLCHLYVPEDTVTCQKFDFPVILSGHDHHVVNEVINNTRLLKAGADAEHAIVLDISWNAASETAPTIKIEILKTNSFEPEPLLLEKVKRAYSILDPLKHTQLCEIPSRFRPLTSKGSRDKLCTVGAFLWSYLKKALNVDDKNKCSVDAVLLSGGDIRGGKDYAEDEYFSFENLKSEIQEQLVAIIVKMSGKMIKEGLYCSHKKSSPGFIQVDEGCSFDKETGYLCEINKQPLNEEKMYRVVCTRWDLLDGPCTPWTEYFRAHESELAQLEGIHVYTTLVSYFAKNIWKNVFNQIDANKDGQIDESEFRKYDLDGDGLLSREEIAKIMRSLGYDVDEKELGFLDCIMELAGDTDRDSKLTLQEINAGLRASLIHSGSLDPRRVVGSTDCL